MAFHTVRIIKRSDADSYQLVYYNPAGRRVRIGAGKHEGLAYQKAARFTEWFLEGKDPVMSSITVCHS